MQFYHTNNRLINFGLVARVISRNLFIIALGLMSCLVVGILYQEDILPFVYTILIVLAVGTGFYLFSRKQPNNQKVKLRDAYFTVALSWFVICFLGSLPYLFSGSIPHFTNAIFESVSGFTTTGSSILSDIEALPKSILFWRSLTHWFGGIGIIVLVIIIMPSLQIGGYHLFVRESSFHEKIKPKIKAVASRLFLIYVMLTVIEIVFLYIGRMDLFDSICHAFGTVATGGFGTKNDSLASYSPYLQYVVMVFMVLSGTNFLIHYYILKREFGKIGQNDEFRFYVKTLALIGFIVSLSLYLSTSKGLEESFRAGYFQVVSIITCTGFATDDYLLWPVFTWFILFFSMFIGGSTGSTAGGIKAVRHLILLKNLKRIFQQLTSQNAIFTVKINSKHLNEDENNAILTFIAVYIYVFIAGSLVLTILGVDFQTAISSVATSMANIGPGLGTVGPVSNFGHLTDAVKLTLAMLMIIGRLEIYTVVLLFTRQFWRHR
jgi:trk system potassium uptake protein